MSGIEDDLRRALGAASLGAGGRVDPVAARRAGDARVRTRQAVTSSLAFSLVILAGLSSVYFASHRSRPTTLGSLARPEPTRHTPSAAPSFGITAGFGTTTLVAGRAYTLGVNGRLSSQENATRIAWGDGQVSGFDGDVGCAPEDAGVPSTLGAGQPVQLSETHVYGEPKPHVGVVVTLTPVCGPPETASFYVDVVPAPAAPSAPVKAASAAVTPSAPTSAASSSPASPSPSASATPSASVSASARTSASARPSPPASVSASARPSPPASVSASARTSAPARTSASARPSPSSAAVVSATPSPTPSAARSS